jgi:trimeric autotransporter adhesin
LLLFNAHPATKGNTTKVSRRSTADDAARESAYFSSSNLSVATVSNGGVVTGVAAGASTISVQVDGETSSFTITVTGATLTSIAITPTNPPSVAKGTTEQFTAAGTYSDGSTQNLTTVVTWTSSNTSVMTINSSDLATGTGAGSATITAAYQSKTATTQTVQVTAATVASIAVTPANQSIGTGSSQQYTATATYTDATTQNVTSTVTWSSSSTSVGHHHVRRSRCGRSSGQHHDRCSTQ